MRAVKITLKTERHRRWLWLTTMLTSMIRSRKTGLQLDLFNQVEIDTADKVS